MATLKELLGSSTPITITLASLGSGSWQQSLFVDNSTNLYLDVFVQLKAKTGATAAGTIDIWSYASNDGGTTYSDGASGADGSFSPTATPNLVLLGSLNTPASTTSYTSRMFSLAQAFGGNIPQRWGLACHNTNGGALDSTGANFVAQYMGLNYQSV